MVSWDVEFEARPFKLKLTRAAKPPAARRYWWTPPDPIYRKVTRLLVNRLQRENAALKRTAMDPRGVLLLVSERDQAQRQFEALRDAILRVDVNWSREAAACTDPACRGLDCRHVARVREFLR